MALRNLPDWCVVTTDGQRRVFPDEDSMHVWMTKHNDVEITAFSIDPDTCFACGGHGEKRHDNDGSPFAYEECPVCGGTGRFCEPDLEQLDDESREAYFRWRDEHGI